MKKDKKSFPVLFQSILKGFLIDFPAAVKETAESIVSAR